MSPERVRRRRRNTTPATVATTTALLLCSSLIATTAPVVDAFQPHHRRLPAQSARLRPRSNTIALYFADAENDVHDQSSPAPRGFGLTSTDSSKPRGRRKGGGKNGSKRRRRKKSGSSRPYNSNSKSNNSSGNLENDGKIIERYTWLRRATKNLLDFELYPPGSLVKGKWHELSSIMLAWSRLVKDGTYDRLLELLAGQQEQQQQRRVGTSSATGGGDTARLTPPLVIEGLLKRIIDEQKAGNGDVSITADLYNVAIEAWAWAAAAGGGGADASVSATKPNSYGAPAALVTADQMQNGNEKRTAGSSAASQSSGPSQALAAARRAAEVVRSLQAAYETTGNEALRPNSHSFLAALGAFTRAACFTSTSSSSDQATAAKEAEGLIHWMEDLAEACKNEDAAPGTVAYSLVMNAYAKSGHRDAGRKAETIFRSLESASLRESASALEGSSDEGNGRWSRRARSTANTFCYNIVINAYSRQGRRGGAVDSAERILTEMENRYNATLDELAKPDVVSYSSVINAWARANRKGYGAQRAENILNRMEAAGIVPNTITFNSVLKCWAKSRDSRALFRAEALFRRMERLHEEGNADVQPDRITFNTLLHTLANAGKAQTAQRAEFILDRMESMAEEGNSELAPNLFTWNSCIEAWSKANVSYSADRAYSLLRRLIALQQDRKATKRDRSVRADRMSYNSVIFALSRSTAPDAAVRAEQLLGLMEREEAQGNPDVRPDVYSYSSVISAWSRSRKQGAGKRAELILERMEQRSKAGMPRLKPNFVSYNSAIDAWAKSGEGTLGARRAEQLLRRMENLYAEGDESVKPTANSYNAVISAWARSGTRCAYWKAEELVNRMWERYESGESDVRPDHCSFNTLINAISKSQREGKAEKALRVLRRMDKLYQGGYKYARPNEMTYTSVLNSCAFTFVEDDLSKRKALDVAIFTLEELQESHYGNPNHVTYGMFLKACANLMSTDDDRWRRVVEPVILQCRRDGYVGELVLKQLQDAAPEHLYRNILEEVVDRDKMTLVKLSDLPEEWRCNVHEKRSWKGRSGRELKRQGVLALGRTET